MVILLPVVLKSLFVIRYSLFVIRYSLFVIRSPPYQGGVAQSAGVVLKYSIFAKQPDNFGVSLKPVIIPPQKNIEPKFADADRNVH